MRKKDRHKKIKEEIWAFVIGTSMIFSAAAPVMADVNRVQEVNITVNPDIHHQTLEGWGTSLCWWGNVIGSWGDADWNEDGRPDREEIAEFAFSPEYLNLNIVRYNVGGGDRENSSIKRCEGLVPGWTEDMTGTADGSASFDPESFYGKNTEEMSDAGQLWMLEQANQYRKAYAEKISKENDIINKVFSNSPPYYMTKSGTSTGGSWGDPNNLKDDCYDDFAIYMARATKWVDENLESKFGTGVSYVEPLNEPDTNYWMEGSTKQEGCIFNNGEVQSKAYREMQSAMDAEEFQGTLNDVKITGTDETSLWNAINSFNRLDDEVKAGMETISAHTYSGNNSERKELYRIAESNDKGLWMSEVTKGGGSHYEGCHESMDAANTRSQSEGIMADLKYMKPSAWIAWLVADSEYECLQTNSNWGLLHAVFEKDGQPVPGYHTNLLDSSGNRKEGVPGEGYWAVTKQFYTMMQYSKYLKAGYIMIDIDDSNMCAAISPEGDELVIVAQNFEGTREDTIDLSVFNGADTAELYRTTDTESCQLTETQDVTDGVLDVILPGNSVSTYVIKASDGAAVCDPDNYSKIVEADVVDPEKSWASESNKFSYEGSWGESAEEYGGGKYSSAEDASVTFTFDGTQAVIYGSKAPEGAAVLVSVDGKEPEDVFLDAENKDGEALLYYTGQLEPGRHTIAITMAAGQEGRLLEINYAKIIYGTLEEKIEKIQDIGPLYTAEGVTPELPNMVYAQTNIGNIIEKEVTWDLEGVDFTEDVVLKGYIEGTSAAASIKVQVVPENIRYFIDCNNPQSPEYSKTDSYAELLNETPDRKYSEGSWGYLDEYGVYDGNKEDNYDVGWYAHPGQEIRYTVPLDTGTYKMTLGFKEWWDQDRPMKVSIVTDEGTTELGKANTWNNGNPWNEEAYEFTISKEGNAIITVSADGGPEPVLSYIRIQGLLDTQGLKNTIFQAEAIDRSQYGEEDLAALDGLIRNAKSLFYRASTTQEVLDQTAGELKAKLEEMAGQTQTEADMAGLHMAVLMAVKMEVQQAESQCYTEESWAAAAEALETARAVIENPNALQEEVDTAFLNLITACNMLEAGVQKVGLKAAIQGAEAVLMDQETIKQYTEESVQAVRDALAFAQSVFEKDVDQETVNQASRALMDAVTGMLVKEENARLDILIRKAKEFLEKEDQYTPSSVERLRSAIEYAKTAENAEDAWGQLAEAMTSLVRRANKTELKNTIDKAEEILSQSEKYVESSIAELQILTDEAKLVYDDNEADHVRVGEALKKLIDEILKARLMGDVNLNGAVDTEDSAVLLQYNAELTELTDEQLEAADTDKSGAADSGDAAVILQFAAEKIVSF